MTPNEEKVVVGLTGTIASGKSTARRYLEKTYGFYAIDADLVGREVVDELAVPLSQVFGEKILRDDGTVDRRTLAQIVFSDAQALSTLNAMTHPKVCLRIRRQIEEDEEHQLFLVEAVELLRSELKNLVDEVWVVYADPQIRLRRLQEERGLTLRQATDRIRSQWDDEAYRAHADVAICSDGPDMAKMQRQCDEAVERLFQKKGIPLKKNS